MGLTLRRPKKNHEWNFPYYNDLTDYLVEIICKVKGSEYNLAQEELGQLGDIIRSDFCGSTNNIHDRVTDFIVSILNETDKAQISKDILFEVPDSLGELVLILDTTYKTSIIKIIA